MNALLRLKDSVPRQPGEFVCLPPWWAHGLPPELDEYYQRYLWGAGWIGQSYIELTHCTYIAKYNTRPELDPFFEDYLFFGTNGGGEEFGVTKSNGNFVYVTIPGVDIDRTSILAIGMFDEFIGKLSDGSWIDGLRGLYQA